MWKPNNKITWDSSGFPQIVESQLLFSLKNHLEVLELIFINISKTMHQAEPGSWYGVKPSIDAMWAQTSAK